MTSNLFKYLTVICFILISFQASQSLAVRDKIVLASDYWCPYNCNPTDDKPGYLVELAKRVFSIYGVEVEYRLMPWYEALDKAEKGEIDGVIGISQGFSQDLAITSTPQARSTISLFTRPDTEWVYDGIDSLRGKRASIILDYNLTDTLKQYVSANYSKNPDLFVLEDGQNAVIDSINHLIEGNVDLYIEDELVVNYYLNQHNLLPAIKNAGRVDKVPLALYIAFSKKIENSKKYLDMLENGISSITATKDVEELKKKYNITN